LAEKDTRIANLEATISAIDYEKFMVKTRLVQVEDTLVDERHRYAALQRRMSQVEDVSQFNSFCFANVSPRPLLPIFVCNSHSLPIAAADDVLLCVARISKQPKVWQKGTSILK